MERMPKPEVVGEYSEKHPVHAGIWVDRVSAGDRIEIGGNIFADTLDVQIEADFDYFEKDLERFTPENVEKGFVENESKLQETLKDLPCNIDLRTFYSAFCVQKKVSELLKAGETDLFDRNHLYFENKNRETPTKLSETIGKTACAERALLGKYLLQKLGIESAFVAGAVVSDEDLGENALNEAHSYIIIRDPKIEGGKTLIYDIARPFTERNLPALYEAQVPMDYETFKDKKNALVESTAAYLDRRYIGFDKQYFGVGSLDLYIGEDQVLRPNRTEK